MIGFVLLAILLFAYLFISNKNSKELEIQKKRYDDSVMVVAAQKQALAAKKDSIKVNAVKDTSAKKKFLLVMRKPLPLKMMY